LLFLDSFQLNFIYFNTDTLDYAFIFHLGVTVEGLFK